MNFEDVFNFLDTAVFDVKKRHLKNIELAVLRGSWQGKKYDEIAKDYSCTPEYLKQDAGPKLWKLLSEVLGEKVSKKNFQTVIERRWLQNSININLANPEKIISLAGRERVKKAIVSPILENNSQETIEFISRNSLVLKLFALLIHELLDNKTMKSLEESLKQGKLSVEDLRNLLEQQHDSIKNHPTL